MADPKDIKDIVCNLLMEHLVPPKAAKEALAAHFGVKPTSVEITEELLVGFGEACYKAGQFHDE